MEHEVRYVKLPEELWGKELVLTSGKTEYIAIFEEEQWREYQKVLGELPVTNKSAREFRRRLMGWAFETSTNEEGNIEIPDCMWVGNFGEEEKKVRVCRMEDFRKEFEDRWIFAEDYASHVIVVAE